MEKEEQKVEQAVELEQEEEEPTLVVRKSRNENGSLATEIASFTSEVSSESNGHIQSEVAENGAQIEEKTPVEDHERENLDGVLENVEITLEEDQEREKLDGVVENEEKTPAEDQEREKLDGVVENEEKTPAEDQEREKLDGVLEDEEKTPAEDQERENHNGVLENESAPINGMHKSVNLVFFDNIEGIWKCRLCSWTYGNGSVCVDHIRNHKGQLHRLMNLRNLVFESKGVESEHTYFGEKQIPKDLGPQKLDVPSIDITVQNNSTSAVTNGYGGELANNGISNSFLKPSQISFQEGITSYESSKEIESAENDLINEEDLEVTEQEVERVIQEQTTHDLFCPNCNSCITKRVILRKRKRRVQISDEEIKRNRTATELHPKLGVSLVESPINQVEDDDPQITAADEERERGPDLFRCLSCFSFFIPTGDGFKFRIFGDKSGKDNVREEPAPSTKKNWFTSMFSPNKPETVVEQGSRDVVITSSYSSDQSSQSSILRNTRIPRQEAGDNTLPSPSSNLIDQSSQPTSSQEIHTPTQEGADQILLFPNQKPSINGKVAVGVGDTKESETVDSTWEVFDSYTTDQLSELKSSQVLNGNHDRDLSVTTLPTWTQVTNGNSTDDAISVSQGGGLKLLISENNGSWAFESSDEAQLSNQTVQPGPADKELTPTSVSVLKASDADGNLNISVSIPHSEQDVRATILTDTVLENKNANFSSSGSVTGFVHHSEVSQHRITNTEIEIHSSEPLKVDNISAPTSAAIQQRKDTLITIDQHTSEPSQVAHPTGMTSASQSVTQSSVADIETRKEFEIEVVKSIVYGGLAESITSLSVVSSAVGGGAATLNVLAMGAANLIGGLFIILHNLWDLKRDGAEQVSNQIVEQRDRYKELLGRRQNFMLHAVLAIISYIIFGLVPPIFYGFSFRESNDKQLKLVMVAAASIVCILILATAKAYTQRRPKPYLKTVTTYVVLGFMVSGVSYVAGELVERLLNELGLFETTPVSNLVRPQMRPTGSGLASY